MTKKCYIDIEQTKLPKSTTYDFNTSMALLYSFDAVCAAISTALSNSVIFDGNLGFVDSSIGADVLGTVDFSAVFVDVGLESVGNGGAGTTFAALFCFADAPVVVGTEAGFSDP